MYPFHPIEEKHAIEVIIFIRITTYILAPFRSNSPFFQIGIVVVFLDLKMTLKWLLNLSHYAL